MKQKYYIIIAAAVLLLAAVILGWRYWRLSELRETIRQEFAGTATAAGYQELLLGFVEELRTGDSLQAATVVTENWKMFDPMFYWLVGRALKFRRAGQPDSAAIQMNAAEAIAEIFHSRRNYDFLQQQLVFYRGLGDDQLDIKMNTDQYLARGYRFRNSMPDSAQYYYTRSIEQARIIGDVRREVENLYWIQYLLYANDKNPASLRYGESALALAEESSYRYQAQQILKILGAAANELGEFDRALGYFQRCYEAAQQLQDEKMRAELFRHFGIIYFHLGNKAKALQSFQASIDLAQQLGYTGLEGEAYIERGITFKNLGEYNKAEADYDHALKLLENSSEKATALINLGDLHATLGLYDLAMEELQQAYELSREAKRFYSAATALINIAAIRQGREAFPEALQSLDEARTMIKQAIKDGAKRSREREAQILFSIGDIYMINRNWPQAVAVYDSALMNIRNYRIPAGIAGALNRLGNVQREMQHYDRAMAYLEEAGSIADTLGDPMLSSNVSYGMGLVYRDRGNLSRAEQYLTRAIAIQEATTRKIAGDASINYFATLQAPYEAIILLKLQQGQAEAAFRYTEQSRARALRKLLSNNGSRSEAPSLPSLADIQAGLSTDRQLIEFKVTEQRLLTFLVGNDGFEWFEAPVSRNELRSLVQHFREALGAVNNPAFEAAREQDPRATYERSLTAAAKLTACLITPIAGRLDSSKTLYIVPDDMLFYVPFAALTSPQETGRFLVEDYPIVLAPSAAIMAYTLSAPPLRPAVRRELQLFAAANPDGQLQKAAAEVRQIAGFFSRVDTLIGHHLSENAVRQALQPPPQIGHFATHANTNVGNPRLAYLEVGIPYARQLPESSATRSASGIRSDDEILTAEEIRGLDLKGTAFICLSACQTAGGRFFAGEGMVGLTTAFVEAGVPAVMSTLWDVYDDYTAELMVRFYRHWIADGQSKARALRRAQKEVIELLRQDDQFGYPHPHRWSGFVLTGDGR
ncbi:MAG: CHAT domain-containing protein [Calditrichaeota bacterium]|nr:CHAT domain-containing protein [Calditrichota bacterium]